MKKVVIVGAGISGLGLAYRLHGLMPELDVTVLEQSDRPGGCAWTERRDGFQVEIGPNGFLDNKPTTLQLCQDLGLGNRLLPASESSGRNRYLFLDGRLRALPNSMRTFLTTDLLSWRGKLRFLAERFQPRRDDAGDESIDAFARRRAGAEVADVFADALVTGIHAGDPALLSVQAAFPRLAGFERQAGSVFKGMAQAAKQRRAEAKARGQIKPGPAKMWSFREGLRLLVETLRERLPRPPLCGVSIKRVTNTASLEAPGWSAQGEGGDRWTADAIILACPAHEQAAVLADLDLELARRIAGIAYNRIAVVALGYRQNDVPMALDGFGFIAPQRLRRDVLGAQWCSSIFPERAPDGFVLMRVLCGGWQRPDLVNWDDDRLIEAVRAELRAAMGIAVPPTFHTVIRWDRAIPQYHLGHLERVAWIENRAATHPGLFLAGNAYHGVALNDCTEQAVVLAERIHDYLTLKR